MNESLDIKFNETGQTLFYDCPQGRPSAVNSVSVHENSDDDDVTEAATTGAASVETNPNTTFDAAAGAGQTNPRICPVAATTGMAIGRNYLLTNATSESEWAEVGEISSGVSFTARHPLHNAYTTGDTVESTRIQISILDSWAADSNNISGPEWQPHSRYRARWNYTVSSVVYVADSYFDLVRYPGDTDITPLDVDRMVPGWLNRLTDNERQTQGVTYITEAYKQVKLRLKKDKKADELIRETDLLNWLTALKADELLAYAHFRSGGRIEMYEIAMGRFNAEYNALVGVVDKLPTDTETGGAAREVQALRISRR